MGKHIPKDIGTNPFLQTFSNDIFVLERDVNLYESDKNIVKDGVTVGLTGSSLSGKKRIVIEKDENIVEYKNHGSFDCFKTKMSLPPKALRMYEYIKYMSKRNETIVHLSFDEYSEVTGVSSYSTFTSDRSLLIKSGIICATAYPNWVWTNPVFFFNGYRATSLKDYNNIIASGSK